MPCRRIRDSICTSDNLNLLSPYAESMYIRLIVSCDDFGRFDARPAVIKGKLFPLKSYDDQQIQSWLFELEKADLLILYEVGGKPYLMMKSWEKYQYKRAKYSKFPPPSESESCEHLCTDTHTCAQVIAGENKSAQSCANAPDIRYTNNDIRITSNEDTSSSTLDISSSLSKEVSQKSNDTKNVSCINDGMSKFTAQLEKPTTAAAYLMDMGIDLDDYFIAQQYHGFIEDGMEEDAIMYAAFLAKSGNKVSWAYVRKILNNWITNGITTKAQAEEEERKHEKESEVNPNGITGRNDRPKGGGNRKSAGAPNLKPRFVGHVYDADGNDITPGI